MSNTVKLSDIAADLGYEAKDIVAKALELDISVKNATSKVSVEDAGAIYDYITSGQIPKLILDRRSSKKAETKPKKDENKEKNKYYSFYYIVYYFVILIWCMLQVIWL